MQRYSRNQRSFDFRPAVWLVLGTAMVRLCLQLQISILTFINCARHWTPGNVGFCISRHQRPFDYRPLELWMLHVPTSQRTTICAILADSKTEFWFGWLPRPGRKPDPRGRQCISVNASTMNATQTFRHCIFRQCMFHITWIMLRSRGTIGKRHCQSPGVL